VAEQFGVPFLGEIELDPQIRIGGDTGKPVALEGPQAPAARGFYAMAEAVMARVAALAASTAGPVVQID
jgi:ATP-binding protein involved in chromosome partitioning